MENRLREIVESLVDSYQEVGGINRVDCGSSLPSNRKVTATCDNLLQVLFPGYHDKEPVPAEELEVITSERIAHLMVVLSGEIAKTLRFRNGIEYDKCGDYSSAAQTVVSEFLGRLPEIRQILATDVEAAYEGDPAARNIEEIILAYPCITAIAIQRCAHLLYQLEVPLIPRIMTEYAHGLTGIDIHPGATIGTHFFIDHGTGVVIGETCVIGNHVKLYHGVTLGARNFPKDEDGNIIKGNKRHPDVGDNVVVYPHATILGGQTVLGEGATIAANVFLRESVPANSFVSTKGEELIVIDKQTKERIVGGE
ncbi:MAG: serine O-acetyltransferase [Verrucomicrobiales bacterium]|nr:serine O-acetyltransferase [Verrucomicrobiales bacterium]